MVLGSHELITVRPGSQSSGFEKYYIGGVSFLADMSHGTKVMLSLRVLPPGRNIFLDLPAVLEPSLAALPPLRHQVSQDHLPHHPLG